MLSDKLVLNTNWCFGRSFLECLTALAVVSRGVINRDLLTINLSTEFSSITLHTDSKVLEVTLGGDSDILEEELKNFSVTKGLIYRN